MRFISDIEYTGMNVLADEQSWPISLVTFLDKDSKQERTVECNCSWSAHEVCKEQGFYVISQKTWPEEQTDGARWDTPVWSERPRTEKEVLEAAERVKMVRSRKGNPYRTRH